MATLEGRGFTETSQTNSVAGAFAHLADGSLQILPEKISFPGKDVALTVTVQQS
ncbi:MAG: hypothetical protein ACYCVN_03765 [Acidimicrobiales bacterium]